MNRSGKMKLVLSSLLLASLCTLSSWSVSSGMLHVTQSPDVSVLEGGTVNISCCWTGNFERVHVSFRMNHTNLKNQTNSRIFSQEIHTKISSSCSALIIENITIGDSGIYVCRVTVEIPTLREKEGYGTVVKVMPDGGEEKEAKEGPPLVIMSLAGVVPLLLIAFTCFCLVLRRRREQALRVIYEVPHDNSDMDKDSTSSSRGSSEWRNVPLYDYFEHVQAPDGK